MDISKVSNVGNVSIPENIKKSAPKADIRSAVQDTVTISKEALKAQEISQANNIVSKTSDVRADKVKEVKEKMAQGKYDNLDAELLNIVADKIVESLIGR